jgi:hypothetical protein
MVSTSLFPRFACGVLICVATSGLGLSAEPAIEYEKVLLPIVLSQQLPGAFGSVWTSEFWGMTPKSGLRAFPRGAWSKRLESISGRVSLNLPSQLNGLNESNSRAEVRGAGGDWGGEGDGPLAKYA